MDQLELRHLNALSGRVGTAVAKDASVRELSCRRDRTRDRAQPAVPFELLHVRCAEKPSGVGVPGTREHLLNGSALDEVHPSHV
jgi:hypothetical protein